MGHTIQWLRKKRTGAVPATPLAPQPSNVTANGATLTWERATGATFYTLQRSTDALSWTDIYIGSNVSFEDSGLTATTLYYYRLIVSNRNGNSDPSENTIVTLDTPTPPAVPAAPTVDAFSNTTVSLSWPAVATATSYTLQRSLSSGSGFSTIHTGPELLFIDSGLTGATDYYYRLAATNADGTSAFSAETAQTTAGNPTVPATPAQPTASNITSSSAQIAWTAVAGATEYEVQRRQTAPSTTAFATVFGPAAQTSFLSTGMSANSTYEFKVRASNSAGASAYSTVRTVITGGVTGTNVQPVSMLWLRKNSGVATHPNFNTAAKVWKTANAPEYIELIFQMGAGFIRGNYAHPDVYLPLLRARKMGWICGVCTEGSTHPTDQTVAETRQNVRNLREDAADVIVGIEGINEPNHNRGGGGIVDTWAAETVDHQRAIWQESQWNLTSVGGPIGNGPTAGSVPNPLKGVKIYGPSLHDVACENSYPNNLSASGGPRHWHQLLDEGILSVQDACGFHCYPGAGIPLRGARNADLLGPDAEGGNVTGRLELMWSAYGDRYPSYTTEWGYHNALADRSGHLPIDERGSGIYYPRGYIQFNTTPFRIGGVGLTNNTAVTGYEFLDDFDFGAKSSQELNFGIYGYQPGATAAQDEANSLDPTMWRAKPQYTKSKALLTHGGREPLDADDYVPVRVKCDVTTTASNDNLEWQAFATKAMSDAGRAFVAIYRNMRCWNRGNGTVVNVPTIPVTITDRQGVLGTFQIGADVEYIDLR